MLVENCIIVCDSAEHTGGVSAVVVAQARGLHKAGIRVFVFAAFGPADPALLEWAERVVCMHPARTPRKRRSEIWNPAASLALAEFIQGFEVDRSVVHVHAISMGLSSAIATALRDKKMPYVITAHDAGWICPTGYFYNFPKASPCALEPFSVACLTSHCDKRSYWHKGFKLAKLFVLDYLSHLKRDAAAIIAPSELLRHRLRSRVPPTTRVITLLNPIHVNDLGPRSTPGTGFLFVGRIWEEKGILELLQAIGHTHVLTVVGDGPRKNALAAQYPRVAFTGWLAADAVAVEMRKAIALILPSVYLEAFGMVVAEALALGVPVIVSDSAGASTMVKNGVNGFVVNMARPHELVVRCNELMDEHKAAAMSRQAYRMYWNQPLSSRAYVQGLLQIFERIGGAHAKPLA